MPKSGPSGSGNVTHFAGVRLRVVGSGNLQITVGTLEDVITKSPSAIVMDEPTRIEPYRIVNFMSQRASFQFKTTAENEWFKVNQLVVYMKPVFTNYPQ